MSARSLLYRSKGAISQHTMATANGTDLGTVKPGQKDEAYVAAVEIAPRITKTRPHQLANRSPDEVFELTHVWLRVCWLLLVERGVEHSLFSEVADGCVARA